MKTLREYIAESEQWMHTPAAGDTFAIELPDEVLVETYIIEVADDCILLDSTDEINRALAEWAALEDTDEGDSGVILETMGYGGLVGEEDEEQLNEFLPALIAGGARALAGGAARALAGGAARALNNPFVTGAMIGSALSDNNDKDLDEGAMKKEMHLAAERMSLKQFKDRYGDEDWIEEFWKVSNGVNEGNIEDLEKNIASAAVKPIPMEQEEMAEAEYQGRKVPLGKPMRGDVKKFKVYVKDPKTGNVKKVNFGHGGKTARRLGQKTMKIKKSNPARRKSFRARHNCDNPGSKLTARYWSCRAW
jgi:hypothetical protein